ncbi:MAG: PKD domain-containing protein [Planctomycetota bacterium]|nr:PKD domain-containing protein [Planctomycetota bacterium]
MSRQLGDSPARGPRRPERGRPWVILSWVAGVVLAASGLAQAAAVEPTTPWLSTDWTVRRIVEAKAAQSTRAAGSEVAVCTFYHGGLAKPDGSDIRVTVRGRQPVGHRVLQMGPGDLCRIAFAANKDETRYYIYYGNPKAPAPEPWEPQRGLLMEVRRSTGGHAEKMEQVLAAWAKAQPLGADFVSHISYAFNPFGDSDMPAIFHYVGWFVPPATGTYQIATSSNGGSWVMIDDKPVVDWAGSHGPVGDARHVAPVALTVDRHKLEYWNLSPGSPVMMVAGWEIPQQAGKFEPIPAKAFLPVSEATLLETDQPGERLVADFFPANAGEAWWPEQYAIRMQFKNLTKGITQLAADSTKCAWNFGDGQTSAAPNPTHIYLASGDYTVSLNVNRVADASTFRTKVRIERNWLKQTDPAIEPVKKYAEEVAQYDFSTLDLRNLMVSVTLFEHEGLSAPLAAVCGELLKRPDLKDGEAPRLGLLRSDHLRKLGKPEEAVAVLWQLEGRLKSPGSKAQTAVEIGEVLRRDLRRWDEAEKEYQRALKTYATAGADLMLRRAHIGLGDIWRHRGDGEKARAAYGAAAAFKVHNLPPNEAAVRVGTLARYVEDYTREKQWDWVTKFLDDWAWEFPADKLKGNWSLLKATAASAQNKKAEAIEEAMDVLGANPQSPYAVRLLMLAAECQVTLGDKDKARLLLQTASDDYPEDPDQAKARTRLMALGGPVATENKPKK